MKNFVRIKSSLFVSSLLMVSSSSVFAADAYDLIEIGDLGNNPSYVYDINNSNVAVGFSSRSNAIDDKGVSYAVAPHAFTASYLDGIVTLQDMGAIDNSNVSVELTNDGNTVTEFFNQEFTVSEGFSINENNLVVGYSQNISGQVITNSTTNAQTAGWTAVERGIYIDSSSGAPIVNQLPDFEFENQRTMRALAVNDNGKIVGYGKFNPDNDVNNEGNPVESYYDNGFVYDINSNEVVIIPSLVTNSGLRSSVRDINNQNVIVGWAQKIVDNKIIDGLFYLDSNVSTEMTQITLFNNETGFAYPWSINNNGRIVGRAVNEAKTNYTAFMHNINDGTTIELGVFNDNAPYSEGFDINDPINTDSQGEFQIVGTSVKSNFPLKNHAFLYEKNVMKDLNDLIDCNLDEKGNRDWVLYEARAINDSGVIIGNGILNGVAKAFMLIPRIDSLPAVNACPVEEVKNKGSGSIPFSFLVIFLPFVLINRFKNLTK